MFRQTLALFLVLAVAYATEFYECDSGVTPATDLRVNDCDQLPCQFKRGKDIIAQMDFKTDGAASKLEPQVRVKALGFWVNYPIGYDDACTHLSAGKCPLSSGDSATYDIQIPVLDSYPEITINVEVTLKNENGDPISCFAIDGEVVA
ncbi:NPC intracellular cholesterol transporter 2 homolog a-like [Ischnura elegans]|uniref:NPC intracellular cholesterol transporter 2 homolog a-like n=1 Tax=Ischnura elegans TaxID=197161 RepID=UPI001ED8AE60|nr:NPC intracellular cholesterol transporter 2 homolog a-like [Ischnura elegans]